jgi:hypothetical protein
MPNHGSELPTLATQQSAVSSSKVILVWGLLVKLSNGDQLKSGAVVKEMLLDINQSQIVIGM